MESNDNNNSCFIVKEIKIIESIYDSAQTRSLISFSESIAVLHGNWSIYHFHEVHVFHQNIFLDIKEIYMIPRLDFRAYIWIHPYTHACVCAAIMDIDEKASLKHFTHTPLHYAIYFSTACIVPK